MCLQKSIIRPTSGTLEGQTRHCPYGANGFSSKSRTFRKDRVVARFEAHLVTNPVPSAGKNNRHRCADYHERKLPVEYESDCSATDQTKDRYHYHCHVDTKELLQLRRISCDAGCEKADRVMRFIEEGYALADNVVEVFFPIGRDSSLWILASLAGHVDREKLTTETMFDTQPRVK